MSRVTRYADSIPGIRNIQHEMRGKVFSLRIAKGKSVGAAKSRMWATVLAGAVAFCKELHAMNPQVSIIIPMYNVQAYVGECLQSLLHQTDGDFEVIAVDDGSTDGTLDVARELTAGDGRFRFFHHCRKAFPQRGQRLP